MAGRGIAWLHVSVVALAVSVSAPVSAFAQAGALAGQVLDADGDLLPGVTVEVTDPLLINPSRRSVTNAQGRYRIPDLRPGLHHTVTFKLPGFSTVVRDVELSAGATTVVDAELIVGGNENTLGSTLTMRGAFVLNCESRPDGTIGPCRRSFFGNPDPEYWLPPPPPPPPPEPVRVGGNISPPAKVTDVPPVYPTVAQAARVQGVVILEAVIGPDGRVTDVKVLRSVALLDDAAIAAVRQWEYAARRRTRLLRQFPALPAVHDRGPDGAALRRHLHPAQSDRPLRRVASRFLSASMVPRADGVRNEDRGAAQPRVTGERTG